MTKAKEKRACKDIYGEMARTERQIKGTKIQLAACLIEMGLLGLELALVAYKKKTLR